MKDCCDNCKTGDPCCSADEAKTKSIDGKELLNFLMKRFKMSKSKAIATMKKQKKDLSFLKNESVNEGGMGVLSTDQADILQGIVLRNKTKNLKAILNIALKSGYFKNVDKKELLGYIDGAKQFVKYMKNHPMESVNEARSTNTEWNKFEKAFGDFFKTVLRLGKANTKLTGNKTDEKIFIKNFNRDVGKFYSLMQSWVRGQSESVNEGNFDRGTSGLPKGFTDDYYKIVKKLSKGKGYLTLSKSDKNKVWATLGKIYTESVNEGFTKYHIRLTNTRGWYGVWDKNGKQKFEGDRRYVTKELKKLKTRMGNVQIKSLIDVANKRKGKDISFDVVESVKESGKGSGKKKTVRLKGKWKHNKLPWMRGPAKKESVSEASLGDKFQKNIKKYQDRIEKEREAYKKAREAQKKRNNESVNEAVEPAGNMAKVANIVKNSQATKLGGVMIDMQSANLLMKLWDAVSDKDKEKMNKMNAKLLTTIIKKLWSRVNLKLPI